MADDADRKLVRDASGWSNAAEDRIELVPYDPLWPERFAEEAARVARALGHLPGLRIEHIGSTAVPGLAAKPILDIPIEIPERQRWPEAKPPLEALG